MLIKKIKNYILPIVHSFININIQIIINYKYYTTKFITTLNYIYNFILFLIIYLIYKYYYKLNLVYFALKASQDVQIFNFFIMLNKLKKKLHFPKSTIQVDLSLVVYCLLLILNIVVYIPVTLDVIKLEN